MLILVINGPNLNLLGRREPEIYGVLTLADIETLLDARADELGVELSLAQSNSEGEIVELIHGHADWDGLIINAGAYTHTSVAIHDALKLLTVPIIELHRGNDGFVAFQRHDASGKFESLFSVRASELPELLSLSDRIVVLRRGRVAASLEKKDFSREGLRLALDG